MGLAEFLEAVPRRQNCGEKNCDQQIIIFAKSDKKMRSRKNFMFPLIFLVAMDEEVAGAKRHIGSRDALGWMCIPSS